MQCIIFCYIQRIYILIFFTRYYSYVILESSVMKSKIQNVDFIETIHDTHLKINNNSIFILY